MAYKTKDEMTFTELYYLKLYGGAITQYYDPKTRTMYYNV